MITGYNYSADSFREALKKGVVRFWYTKTNGEEREAFGTLDTDIIENYFVKPEPATGRKRSSSYNFNRDSEEYVQYYDVYAKDKKTGVTGGWRSFRIDSLIKVDDEYDAY